MNAWDISDALLAGRQLPRAKVRRVLMGSDTADALYANLFQIIAEPSFGFSFGTASALTPPHPSTANAWACILDYAAMPSRGTYGKIVQAARSASDVAATVIRLAPLVLVANHRRHLLSVIRQVAGEQPAIAASLAEVCRDLSRRGPGRLYARAHVAAAKR